MENALASRTIGSKCVQWYSCIVSRDIEHAVELKVEIDKLIEGKDLDENTLTYYQLVNYRHDLLMEDIQKRLSIPENEIKEEKQSDILLRYMYYFFTGQDEFYKGNYKSAIRLYQLASKLIENVECNLERAEFYHRMGVAYYRLNQYGIAMNYIEESKMVFLEDKEGQEKVLNCDLIIACIHSEVSDYEKADTLFDTAISESSKFPVTKALLLRAKGLNFIRQDKLEEAERVMKQALEIKEHQESYVGYKTKADLANINLRLGREDRGIDLLEEAERYANENDKKEFVAKNLITRNLYVDFNEEKLEEALEILERNEHYFEVFEVAEEIAKYYESMNDYKKCSYYLKLSLKMHIKQNELGE